MRPAPPLLNCQERNTSRLAVLRPFSACCREKYATRVSVGSTYSVGSRHLKHIPLSLHLLMPTLYLLDVPAFSTVLLSKTLFLLAFGSFGSLP